MCHLLPQLKERNIILPYKILVGLYMRLIKDWGIPVARIFLGVNHKLCEMIRIFFSFDAFSLPFHWPRALQVTCSNCLQITVSPCVVPSKYLFAQIINTLLTRNFRHVLVWEKADRFPELRLIQIWKQTWWSNDKIVIELVYNKISWQFDLEEKQMLRLDWRVILR